MNAVLFVLMSVSFIAAALFAVIAWRVLRVEQLRSQARVKALAAAIDEDVAAEYAPIPIAGADTLFRAPAARLTGRPMLRALVVIGMVLALGAAAAVSRDDAPQTPASAMPTALELLSTQHTLSDGMLAVTGLVRNPSAASRLRRVTAVVFAFDREGAFLASGRAPVDFAVLDSGDESPFTVSVPNADRAARYRVSFRTDEGLVRHVDQRARPSQLAGR